MIVVLDDDGGGTAEFGGEAARGFEINEIIVGELFALKLVGGGQALRATAGGDIERGGLVWIFAVAQFLLAAKGKVKALRQNWFFAEGDLIGGDGEALEFG